MFTFIEIVAYNQLTLVIPMFLVYELGVISYVLSEKVIVIAIIHSFVTIYFSRLVCTICCRCFISRDLCNSFACLLRRNVSIDKLKTNLIKILCKLDRNYKFVRVSINIRCSHINTLTFASFEIDEHWTFNIFAYQFEWIVTFEFKLFEIFRSGVNWL